MDANEFIDKVYLDFSNRLQSLERKDDYLAMKIEQYKEELTKLHHELRQYKGKIQRIEQFLIENGLIRLVKKIKEYRAT